MPGGYEAFVEVLPDFSKLKDRANSQLSGILGSAGTAGGLVAGNQIGAGIVGGIGRFAGPVLAAVVALGIGTLVGQAIGNGVRYALGSISLASDLNESFNANDVTFGADVSKQLQLLGQSAPQRLALTRNAFAGFATQFSAFAKTVRGNDVVGFLDQLTTRGADFASVYNLEVADALTLFQSGLAGETEPLRRFGLDLSAAAVKTFAYANGIGEVGKELTEAEKVQARYGLLLEQTSATQGDAANTAGQLAGQQRRLNVALEEAQTRFGTAILPTALDLTRFANEELIPILGSALDEAGPKLAEAIERSLPQIKELVASAANDLPKAIDAAVVLAGLVSDSIQGDLQFFSDAEDVFERTNTFFTEYLPAWAEGSVTVEESWQGFFNFWDLAWDGTADTVENKSDEIKDHWQSSLAGLKKLTADFSLQSEGYALAQGFADGITTGSELAALAAERMALRARDTVRNTMLIQSPSKVMAELGGFVAEGFALGITGKTGMVESAVGLMLSLPNISGSTGSATAASTTGARGVVRDVHYHGVDGQQALTMLKQEVGGRLSI